MSLLQNYRHDYSEDEWAVWAERITSANAKHAWIYFNNDAGANAIRNAQALMKLLITAG
jgi:uncharacterized protein YecE (DUF72 family)